MRRASVDSTTKPHSYLPKHYQVPVLPYPLIISEYARFVIERPLNMSNRKLGLHNTVVVWLKCDQLLIAAVKCTV